MNRTDLPNDCFSSKINNRHNILVLELEQIYIIRDYLICHVNISEICDTYRHFSQKSGTPFPNLLTNNSVDHVLSLSPHCKHLTSALYNYIDNLVPHSLRR